MSNYTLMLVFIIAAVAVFFFIRYVTSSTTISSSTATTSTAKPQAVSKTQMAEDIRATKTSQIDDAVSILDDLGSTSSTYRHYCELVGTSMATSNIVAPYSKRNVAYYDIKCYRIDATYGGGQQETLVAHEHSFDPFFFTDGSCDTPVYIDLESFGDNVILVNSTNHIEGPNSDFAQAYKNATAARGGTAASSAYACVGQLAERAAHVLMGPICALRNALVPRNILQPAYALAGDASLDMAPSQSTRGPKVVLFGRGGGPNASHGHSGGGSYRPQSSQPSFSHGTHKPQGHAPQSRPYVNVNIGYGSQMPGGLGSFMGPSPQPFTMGGHYTTHRPYSSNSGDLLLGMGLSMLLNSINTAQQQAAQGYTTQADTCRGYRLVENIVPLGSPIYCIGEIYRHGTDVYMSRSLAKDYPTSFFATKPEAEVLSVIGSR